MTGSHLVVVVVPPGRCCHNFLSFYWLPHLGSLSVSPPSSCAGSGWLSNSCWLDILNHSFSVLFQLCSLYLCASLSWAFALFWGAGSPTEGLHVRRVLSHWALDFCFLGMDQCSRWLESGQMSGMAQLLPSRPVWTPALFFCSRGGSVPGLQLVLARWALCVFLNWGKGKSPSWPFVCAAGIRILLRPTECPLIGPLGS